MRLLSPNPPVSEFPRPIVLDSSLNTPPSAAIFRLYAEQKGKQPLVVYRDASDTALDVRRRALENVGAQLIAVNDTHNWKCVADALAAVGITRLMVEGGAAVIDSLLSHHAREPFIDVCIVTEGAFAEGSDGYGYSVPLEDAHLAVLERVPLGKDTVVVMR